MEAPVWNVYTGIWRCRGQLIHVDIVQSSQNPMLLDVHHFTYIVVKDCHARVLHDNMKEILNELQLDREGWELYQENLASVFRL